MRVKKDDWKVVVEGQHQQSGSRAVAIGGVGCDTPPENVLSAIYLSGSDYESRLIVIANFF